MYLQPDFSLENVHPDPLVVLCADLPVEEAGERIDEVGRGDPEEREPVLVANVTEFKLVRLHQLGSAAPAEVVTVRARLQYCF
jgi:hypothetical protein